MTRIATATIAMTMAPVVEPARTKPLFGGFVSVGVCDLRTDREALGRAGERGRGGRWGAKTRELTAPR